MKKLLPILISILIGGGFYSYWLLTKAPNIGELQPQKELIWNGNIERFGNQNNGVFKSKWVNFKDENNEWRLIDDSFEMTTNDFSVVNAPFEVSLPLRSTDTAVLNDNHRWNVKADKEITEAPLTMSIQAENVNDVPGTLVNNGRLLLNNGWMENTSYVIYPNAYPDGDLIYYLYQGRTPRLEKLIVFNQVITQDIERSFIISFNRDPEISKFSNGQLTKWLKQTNLDIPAGDKIRANTANRKLDFAPIHIWDSSLDADGLPNRVEKLVTDIQPLGNGSYRLTKHILASFFVGATLPVITDEAWFLPDADPETNTWDGCSVYETGGTWATARDATAATPGSSSDTSAVLTSRVNNNFDIYRCPMGFDVSGIEDNATVGSSSVRAINNAIAGVQSGTYDYIALTRGGWSATLYASASTTVTGGDAMYDQFYSVAGANILPTGALFASTSENVVKVSGSTTGVYYNFLLNAEGQQEITNHITGCCAVFAWTEGHDMKNVAPSALNGINWRSADQAGTSSDPYLVVTWTLPAAEVPSVEPTPIWDFLFKGLNKTFARK